MRYIYDNNKDKDGFIYIVYLDLVMDKRVAFFLIFKLF